VRTALITVCIICFLGASLPLFPQEPKVHIVQPGDTLHKLAAKFLGDKKYWKELVIFNDLPENIGPNEVPAVDRILIPGPERTKALDKLEQARTARKQAKQAQANKFSKTEYAEAERSFNQAENAFIKTNYVKSGGHANIAEKQFKESISIADRRAVVSREVTLGILYGTVHVQSTRDGKWEQAAEKAPMAPGVRIRTGEQSGALLLFRDRSLLKLRQQSELTLKTYSNDLRTDKVTVEILCNTGTVDGYIKSMLKDSSFTIKTRSSSFNLDDVTFYLGCRVSGDIIFSVHEGEANVTTGGVKTLRVKNSRGIHIDTEGNASPSQALLAAPKLKSPKNNGISFVQKPVLEWHRALGVSKYRVEVSKDVSFSRLIDDIYTANLNAATSILDVGKLFWRVSSIDQNGLVGPPAEAWTFFIQRNLELTLKPNEPLLEKEGIPYANQNHQFRILPVQQENSVDWIEVSIDDGVFKRLQGPIQLQREGKHTIKYRAVDIRGERQVLEQYSVLIDNTPPVVHIAADKSPFKKDDDFYCPVKRVFMAVAEDGLSGIRNILIKVDDEEFRDFTPKSLREKGVVKVTSERLRFKNSGRHVIAAKAQDLAGNWTEEKKLKIFVDNTPPQITIRPTGVVEQAGKNVYVSGTCSFTFEVDDDLSGAEDFVLVRMDGGEFKKVQKKLDPLQGGPHSIGYKGVDNVGNISEEKIYSFQVDALPPETNVAMRPQLVQHKGKFYGPKGLALKFIPSDNLSGVKSVEVDINDKMLPGVVQNKDGSMKCVKEGVYTITYFSSDKVDNREDVKQVVFTIDGTPPEVNASIDGPKHQAMAKLFISAKSSVHIDAKDNIAGVNRIEISKNGGPFIQYRGALRGLPEEAMQLTFRAVDNVGNVSEIQSKRITVDNTPPKVWIEKRKDESCVIQALEELSGVHQIYARIDNGELKRYQDGDVLPQGKKVEFWAKDNVGNESEHKEERLD